MKLKRWGYWLFLVPVALPAMSYWLWTRYAQIPADVAAWLPLIVLYLVVPAADWLIGKDPHNPPETDVRTLSSERYYRWLVLLSVPLALCSLGLGLWLITSWADLSLVGMLGLTLSFGMIHSSLMINSAHELIHKSTRMEQRAGGFLLCLVCYPGFKIEHMRGHHVHVATPEDHSTSRYGESLYRFLGRALRYNAVTAWRLETQLLKRRGKPVLSVHNELIRWYALTLLVATVCFLVAGPYGLAFFLLQSLTAVVLLETVNYLEHYGLTRQRLSNGRYERTTHHHSWNSNYLLTNLLSFQLQRHSDHHAHPQRRYQVLRHFDDSPQLPAGYSAMVLLAAVPPLWMRVMNPRVDRYYARNPATS